MSDWSARHRRPLWRLLARIVPLLLMFALLGCGSGDPVRELWEDGARIEYQNRQRREKIASITFPKKADDEMVARLKDEAFASTQQVDLSNTQITDAALKSLQSLERLQELNLNNTNVTDEGLKHLARIKTLHVLDLGDTLVTDEGLEHLKSLEDLQLLLLKGKPRPKEPKPRSWQTAFRLGIDLAGGTNLVYQVVPDVANNKEVTAEAMDQTVGAVKRRLDPSGTEEITVRKVGSDRIEVIIPQADPEVVNEKKRLMTRLGSLEFALLANRRDNDNIIREAQGIDRDLVKGGRVVAGWRDVGVGPDGKPKDVGTNGEVVWRDRHGVRQFLVIFGRPGQRVTGDYLRQAKADTDNSGRPAVRFFFNTRGATLFATLTGDHLPGQDGFRRRLAILLDGKVHSAPSIEDVISDTGIIHGSFTQEEVQELTNVLNAGALALSFKTDDRGNTTPISEQTISPLLGHDVQEKGRFAIIVASIVVFAFMAVYYLVPGLIADLCLLLNLIMVMGAMAFIDAAFTLPGLAGIVLTIGMAVDANVLIFERIREEQKRGSSPRMSIQNGFGRAFTTIVDANLTTLITAVVLYMIGTDQVRGFAVTLFIGIVMSMFASLYFGRLIFDILERKRRISLKMFSLVGATNWNFVSKKTICAAASVTVIVAGLIGVFFRGHDMLDIDLDGGSMVTLEFQKPLKEENGKEPAQQLKEVLSRSDVLKDGLSIEQLTLRVEGGTEQTGRRFRVRGKEKDAVTFKNTIHEVLMKADPQKYALRQVRILDRNLDDLIKPVSEPKKKKGEAGSALLVPSEFIGGHQVLLTLSDGGMKRSTFESYLVRHLGEIKTSSAGVDAADKYSNPKELIRVDGVQQSAAPTSQGEEPKYNTVRLYVTKTVARTDLLAALQSLQKELDETPIFPEVNTFDAAVAGDMQRSAVLAMLFSLAAIIGYIWFRFHRATFGIAAVVALVHDVLAVLGIVALAGYLSDTPLGPWLDFKINLPIIAALLTLVGYSLNDTIVVFDRIREVRGKNPALTNDMVNVSLNQTLSRTLLTSFTTFVVVAILYGWGGEGIRGFAFCLVLGIAVGTYSSVYVASPVLLWLMNRPGSAAGRAAIARGG